MKNKLKKIVIATGGTGGHVLPAYNLAKHFKSSNQANVEIISDSRGLKYLKNYNDIKFILPFVPRSNMIFSRLKRNIGCSLI